MSLFSLPNSQTLPMETLALKDVLFHLIRGKIDTHPAIAQLCTAANVPCQENYQITSFSEDRLIDLLIFTEDINLLQQICADLAAQGSVFALPALLSKLECKDRKVTGTVNAAIKKIKT